MSIDHSHTADWEALAEMDKQSPDASHPMTVAGRVLADELRVHLPCQDDVTLGLDLFTVLGVVVAAVIAVALVSAWFGLWPAAAFLVAVLGVCVAFVAVTASRVRAARRRGVS